jgi:hypothetical protein
MMTDVSQKIRDFLDAAIQAAELLSARNGLPLEYSHIESALLLEMELDSSTDLLEKQLDKEQIVAALTHFNFMRLFPTLLQVISFEKSIVPDQTTRKLTEVTVRSNGEVWQIHQNDADPFPSNPHAHNREKGLKLHLGTGELYFGTRNTGKKISRKDLQVIRKGLSKFSLPSLTR